MDLIDQINTLSRMIDMYAKKLETEEATKTSLIMPFIQALGYNVFSPEEVIPEYTTDHGVKKGEKVDYAIKKEGKIIMLFECKKLDAPLKSDHASQLYRYFSVSEARFAVLTNGRIYRFFTDLEKTNQMDRTPFFEFDITNFKKEKIDELKKFTSSVFDIENILEKASELKYINDVKRILKRELEEPSEDFIKFFVSQIYDGRLTERVLEQFRPIIKSARVQFLNEKINERLSSAINQYDKQDNKKEEVTEDKGIVTTAEEFEAFNIVKAILREKLDVSRIAIRDTKSYCGVLLDDNRRKPICRFHFSDNKKQVSFFVSKQELKLEIQSLDDIFVHAEKLFSTIEFYETGVDSDDFSDTNDQDDSNQFGVNRDIA